ncbi:EAL domain-containing protein [Colwellia ponticola]|uniref:cyclic-guanylate-specific phosphodiesterase n=1 Tax=Colwellia ponticola TaxID=2304625 RepID=A0A8H2JQH3_9GAMM|nr:EAL domain-containing protein [Colwellia ponticola]TMM46991.1 EAL domain-containing protein [Colwellia ponticola]
MNIRIRSLLLSTLFALAFIYLSLVGLKKDIGNQLAATALIHVDIIESIYTDTFNTLNELNAKSPNSCNETTLLNMSRAMFKSAYIKSVGFISDEGMLICTTGLGVLAEPQLQSGADYTTTSGFKIWIDKELLLFDELYKSLIIESKNFNAVLDSHNTYKLFPQSFDWQIIFMGNNRQLHVLGDKNLFINKKLIDENSLFEQSYTYCSLLSAHCVYLTFNKQQYYQRYSIVMMMIVVAAALLAYSSYITLIKIWKRRRSTKQRVKKGLASNGFYPLFQPIVILETGEIVGCEVLARYQDSMGDIFPDTFIPVIKDLNATWAFTDKLITKALTQINDVTLTNFKVNFNIYPQDIGNENVLKLLTNHMIKQTKHNICIEIIEDEALSGSKVLHCLEQLVANGMTIAIDDFGTGYSNLKQISSIPCQILKIDRSFINDMEAGSIKSTLIPHIVSIAKKLSMDVVAEGVENSMQHDALLKIGIKYGQGWGFGKPMTAEDFIQKVTEQKKD